MEADEEKGFRKMVGRQLREARLLKGWRQVDLAAALGISPAMISRVESGIKTLNPWRLRMAARELEVSIDSLLGVETHSEARMSSQEDGPAREITPEQAIENYQLIQDEPMLSLKVRRGSLTVEDMADIADYIRFVRSERERLERGGSR